MDINALCHHTRVSLAQFFQNVQVDAFSQILCTSRGCWVGVVEGLFVSIKCYSLLRASWKFPWKIACHLKENRRRRQNWIENCISSTTFFKQSVADLTDYCIWIALSWEGLCIYIECIESCLKAAADDSLCDVKTDQLKVCNSLFLKTNVRRVGCKCTRNEGLSGVWFHDID